MNLKVPDIGSPLQALTVALLLAILLAAGANAGTGPISGEKVPGSVEWSDSALASVLPDSLAGTPVLPMVVVAAPRRSRMADTEAMLLEEERIRDRDGPSVAELGPLLPSTQVNVNSRGEVLFMVRGAPERHLRVFLDGIPLTVPWDERADLSLLPADAIAAVRVVRGVGSALDGPNALAGVITLIPREAGDSGPRSLISVRTGEAVSYALGLSQERVLGDWRLLASLSHRDRDAWLLPAGFAAAHNQGGGRARSNSDLRQSSLLLRLCRRWEGGAELRLSLLGLDAEKGVPPETHLADARFWRYPLLRRGIAGLSLALPLGETRRWRLRTDLSADRFRQEIRSFDDAGYDTPPLAAGSPYESDHDLSLYASTHLTRELREDTGLNFGATLRHTRHRESLEYDGPENLFSQLLASLACELDAALGTGWHLRLGGGYERAATPETGDKPSRDPTDAGLALLRLVHRPSDRLGFHLALSRRSRFPSLRELYSGALGKFVPNPDLAPERQDLLEVGALLRGRRHEFGLSAFANRLHGGIEKQLLAGEEGRFQRINAEEIRSLGLELLAAWRPLRGLSLTAQHSLLHARRREGGAFDAPAEDRADYVSSLDLTWTRDSGLRLRLEGALIGPRHSADAGDEEDGLTRLPAQASWNIRVAWLFSLSAGAAADAELYLRLNNLFDQRVDSQVGLPGPGRMLQAGLRLRLGE